MNISDFGKTMESVRKHRETKLVTIEKISNYLLSGQNYQTPKLFSKNLVTIELKKKTKTVQKTVYLGLLILERSKIVMFEFWYDYVKTK